MSVAIFTTASGSIVNWTVPANVYSIKMEAIGAGGAGSVTGGGTLGRSFGGGGGGGYAVSNSVAVTPGQTIQVYVARVSFTEDSWAGIGGYPTSSTNGVAASSGQDALNDSGGTGGGLVIGDSGGFGGDGSFASYDGGGGGGGAAGPDFDGGFGGDSSIGSLHSGGGGGGADSTGDGFQSTTGSGGDGGAGGPLFAGLGGTGATSTTNATNPTAGGGGGGAGGAYTGHLNASNGTYYTIAVWGATYGPGSGGGGTGVDSGTAAHGNGGHGGLYGGGGGGGTGSVGAQGIVVFTYVTSLPPVIAARLSSTGTLYVNSGTVVFDEVTKSTIQLSQNKFYAHWLDEIVANYVTTVALGSGTPVVTVFATSGTGTWTVPSDWSSTNAFYCVGAGGGGASTVSSSTIHYGGGGGGGYTVTSNVTSLTPGQTFNYKVGTGGTGGISGPYASVAYGHGSPGGNTNILLTAGPTPTFVSNSFVQNATTSTILTLSTPTGMQVGDLMIAVYQGTNFTVWTAPAGWYQINDYYVGVSFKYATATDIAGTTYNFTVATTAISEGYIIAYRNAGTFYANPNGTNATSTPPAIDVLSDNSILFEVGWSASGLAITTPPTGFTTLVADTNATNPFLSVFYQNVNAGNYPGVSITNATATISFAISPNTHICATGGGGGANNFISRNTTAYSTTGGLTGIGNLYYGGVGGAGAGAATNNFAGAGGGGGSAGPNGNGGNGGPAAAASTTVGSSGGGGGSDGGGAGNFTVSATTTSSGSGGNNSSGAGGGASRSTSGTGNAGSAGGGGSGSFTTTTVGYSGGNGSNNTSGLQGTAYGLGGGSGGSIGSIVNSAIAGIGAGGGGGGYNSLIGVLDNGGQGGNGLLVIVYTPGGTTTTYQKSNTAMSFSNTGSILLSDIFDETQTLL